MNQVTRAELKRRAKAYMAGNMGILMLCMVIVFAVTGAVSGLTGLLSEKVPQFSLVGMVLNLAVSAPFTLGIAAVYMQTAKDGTAEIGTLFSGFSRIVDAVVVIFLINLFTGLWMLLFIVPGIIKSIGWSQTYYIMAEHPEIKPKDAMDISAEIMGGHKGEYFVLQLSFILWYLLGIVTCGIGMLYVVPYVMSTQVQFYVEVSKDYPFDME